LAATNGHAREARLSGLPRAKCEALCPEKPMTVYSDLIAYRELFANLFRRDLQKRYKGSVLGVVWVLLPPLILMAIYLLVFNVLWAVTSDIQDYTLYLLAGLATWVFFATTLQIGSRAMLDNADLIRKTRFPRQLVAFSVVGANVVTYAVMLLILLVACFIFVPESRDTELLAIPLAALFVCFVAGVTLTIACLDALFRDVEHLVGALLLPWFFLTPVFWSWTQFTQHQTIVQIVRYGNPVSPAVSAIRDPLWAGTLPRAVDAIYLVCAAVVALALGAFTFRRFDDRIAVEL
jgi:lipopolysaccharide transport system permease protein